MKKLIVVILLLGTLISNYNNYPRSTNSKESNKEIRAIFISYIELNKYIKGNDKNTSKKNIKAMINNIKNIKCNTIILQVRSNCDAIYKSNIFPSSLNIVEHEGDNIYDVFNLFIKEAHKKRVKVIAWINPYRIRTSSDISTISKSSPAYKYLNTDTVYINNGIYFNPSKKEVEDLIVNGVKEVINYKIDGLLFDDYFYPDNNIDEKDYKEYIKNNIYINPNEYRLNIINKMIKRVHEECSKKNIKFGISPDGNMENNYNKNYADVKTWLSSSNYVDFIMPQIYYGFYNSSKNYTKVVHEWEELITVKDIDYYVALAFYKVGREDMYAKEGIKEWVINNNMIMREIIISRNLVNYKGFSLFRYDNLFNKDEYTSNTLKELENLKKILK